MSEKRRECLKCGKLFVSAGPGHRLCGSCKSNNRQLKVGRVAEQAKYLPGKGKDSSHY